MLPTNPLLNATAPAGPHLPTATLRQYAAGTLAPAAQHRVEAHTLACPRCADILEGLLQTTPATTDQALAQLQQRLRRRVQQQTPAALPATRPRHAPRWLVLQLAAAAALLFGLVAGGWWTWQQRHAAPATAARPANGPRAAAPATATVAEAPLVAADAPPPAAAPAAVGTVAAARPRPPRMARSALKPQASSRPAPPPAAGQAEGQATTTAPAAASVLAAAPTTVDSVAPKFSEVVVKSAAPARKAVGAKQALAHDSGAVAGIRGRVAGVAVQDAAAPPATLVRDKAMPAAPAIAPTPQGGYPAWREKIRREATEFKPEAPEPPLSGAVQLRVLVGADGKIQEIRVLHGLRADYDAEAQRLVCQGPGWIPGIGGGKRASQAVDVAVPFQ